MLAAAEVAATVAAACTPDAFTAALEGFTAAIVMRAVYAPHIR